MRHTLVITGDPEGPWEIEHPGECRYEVWSVPGHEVSYWDADCTVSRVIESDPHALGPIKNLPLGRYTLNYRHEGEGEHYEDWLLIGCGSLADHGPHEGCPGEGPFRAVRS